MMKKIKQKKIILITVILLFLVIFGVFLYLIIYSNMYKLECSRVEEFVTNSYNFEFNPLKKINNIEKKVYLEMSTKEEAIDRYNEAKKEGKNVQLDEKTLIFSTKDIDYDFNDDLKEAEEKCTNWGYYCRMVRK